MNIVGTTWVAVTPYLSIASSIGSAPKRSIRTTVAPSACAAAHHFNGAV